MSSNYIVSIIPARGGSKGVPKKNIKELKDHPLIAYSIKASQKSQLINRTIISTDSEEIAGIAKKYGAEIPFLRPVHLASDESTDYEFIEHALNWFQDNEGKKPDYLVQLRPTTPLRDPALIDKAITDILADDSYTSLRSVHQMSESAYKCFEVENSVLRCLCTHSPEIDSANNARQKFPTTFQANGYVDILKSTFIIQNKKLHGNKVYSYITPTVTEIDTFDDFEYLEYQINKKNKIFNVLFG